MRRLAQGKFSKRLLIIDLPAGGFLLGALFAVGFNLYRLVDFHIKTEENLLCQVIAEATRELPELSSISLFNCSAEQLPNSLISRSLSSLTAFSEASTLQEIANSRNQLRYNAATNPPFRRGRLSQGIKGDRPRLDDIINGVLADLKAQKYPTDAVSISLVDLTGICCEYGYFQDQQLRYPSSIVKLFWLVTLYGHYEAGLLEPALDTTWQTSMRENK